MYQYKKINFGFVVVCPIPKNLKSTINSIDAYYSGISKVVISDCKDPTITSMINVGMSKAECPEWNFVVLANGSIKPKLDIKYSYFIEATKDILFPIIGRKLNFADSDFAMMLIHKKTFKEIGEFPKGSVENSKLTWTATAVEKGCRFKGIVGGRP